MIAQGVVRALVVIVALIATVISAGAEVRTALVIGNGRYVHQSSLPNPPNDANDVGAALQRLGFAVTTVIDADRKTMLEALYAFEDKASAADIAVIFYAGHGIEVNRANFLIPVDATLTRDTRIGEEAIGLDRLLLAIEGAKKLRLVLLDACRENPFAAGMTRSVATRAIGRGLAAIEPPGSILVAFAAKENTVADDGNGQRNSPFTTALLRHIEAPGLELQFIFRQVRDDVVSSTGGRQEPWLYGSLTGARIYLSAATAASDGAAPPAIAPAAPLPAVPIAPSLAPSAEPGPVAPSNAADRTILAIGIQRELQRIGCLRGAIDGNWSSQSRASLERFNSLSKSNLELDAPTYATLTTLAKVFARICPEVQPPRSAPQAPSRPAREAPPPTRQVDSAGQASRCRLESVDECRSRVCAAGLCGGNRGNRRGLCRPENRVKICG